MKTCVILGSLPLGPVAASLVPPDAYIIAADAGWLHAQHWGLHPDLVLGDFDSAPQPPAAANLLVSPAEKDDTDTMLAVKKALEWGAQRVLLLGCLGGRHDHTYANIQALLFLARRGVQNLLADETTQMQCAAPGEVRLAARAGHYVSVFAVGGEARGVDEIGLKYPLDKATLMPDMPLGVSNEFAAEEGVIRHTEGYLLVMVTPMDGAGA